jgi:hypothetical protein
MVKERRPQRQRTSINVDPRLWRRFKATLALQGKDMSPILEEFIHNYLEQHEASARAEANDVDEGEPR